MQKLNLIQWRDLHGNDALIELWKRAGFSRNYRHHIMGGFSRMSFKRARQISALDSDLDPMAIYDMFEVLSRRRLDRKRAVARKLRKTQAAQTNEKINQPSS